ncbi:MAG: integrase arm-type DNA-binding domain-containing protein [Proteobacteria bacterium]|nr:integrase arm-type DNA-binding domain-containing protein [Pseudomonadota bacterium]
MRLKTKFTDRGVKALKHRKKQYDAWEAGRTGLGIRVAAAPSRRKSWTFIYRFAGVACRMGFGEFPAVSVKDANKALLEAKRLLADGINPGKVQRAQRRADREAKTIKERIPLFIKRQEDKDLRSIGDIARVLNKDVLPRWGDLKVKAVTRADISELVEEIAARGAVIMARRTHSYVHGFFEYCIGLGLIEVNPASKVDLPGRERSRTRILSPKEMRTFWWGLDKARTDNAVRLALRLQLATVLRRSEVAGAHLEEFDEQEGVWLIPSERSKNRTPHRVWLSPLALSIFEEAKKSVGPSGWLFPS